MVNSVTGRPHTDSAIWSALEPSAWVAVSLIVLRLMKRCPEFMMRNRISGTTASWMPTCTCIICMPTSMLRAVNE